MDKIKFFLPTDDFGYLSNFAKYPISLKGVEWLSVEHYYQAQKVAGSTQEETIRQERQPLTCTEIGHTVPLRSDWEDIKEDVMRDAIWAKFTQHVGLGASLKQTTPAIIESVAPNESYWGCGEDGKGQNIQGKILMQIRDKLKDDKSPLIAQSSSWLTHEMAPERETILFEETYTYQQFRRMLYGYVPSGMDDEWFIYFERSWLKIVRSWTGHCLFMLNVEESNADITSHHLVINKNTCQNPYSETALSVETVQKVLEETLFVLPI